MKELLSRILNNVKYRIPKVYLTFIKIRKKTYDLTLEGERHSYGKCNSDVIFFVIKLNFPMLGLFGIYNAVLGYLRYANEKGYIRVE
jgi:hypothetical protein